MLPSSDLYTLRWGRGVLTPTLMDTPLNRYTCYGAIEVVAIIIIIIIINARPQTVGRTKKVISKRDMLISVLSYVSVDGCAI